MKKVLAVIGVLVLIVLVTPMFLSSHFSMSRTIEINAPLTTVFTNLTDLNVYAKWNPFPEGDPTNTNEITGNGVGAYMTWKGEKTGEGKMTIAEVEQDKKITVKMDFYKPMNGEGVVQWLTSSKSETSTELVWTFEQNLPYFNRYFGLFMDSMMGKHFEKVLSNYKAMMESAQ